LDPYEDDLQWKGNANPNRNDLVGLALDNEAVRAASMAEATSGTSSSSSSSSSEDEGSGDGRILVVRAGRVRKETLAQAPRDPRG